MTHWSVKYVEREERIRFALGGEGPDEFDCWNFVRHVYKTDFDIEVAQVSPERPDDWTKAKHYTESFNHDERKNWYTVITPKDGDAVLLSPNKLPTHVGVFADIDGGLVVHCLEGVGVCAQSLSSLALARWNVIGFYRHV